MGPTVIGGRGGLNFAIVRRFGFGQSNTFVNVKGGNMIDVVAKYGLDVSGQADNAAKLAELATDIANIRKWQRPMPRLVFTEGIIAFSAWPDLAYDNLQIVADGECRLQYTGNGDGIVFDGSLRNPAAEQPGIDNLTFSGFDIYAAQGGVPLSFKGIHRSSLSVRVLAFSNTGGQPPRPAIQMNFCIITTLHPVVVTGHINPIVGLWVDAWPGKLNLQSTACTIANPCLEGCSIGIQWQNAGSCVAYGGTIENCGAGVQLGANAGNNMHYSVEMEGNGFDVFELSGSKANGFLYCGNGSKLHTNFGLISGNWAKN